MQEETTYVKQMAKAIYETYREVLIPNMPAKKYFYSKDLASQIVEIDND